MNDTITLQLTQRGVVTLPKSLREQYNLQTGDFLTLLDLGGVFVISSQRSEVDNFAREIVQKMEKEGATLENMLASIREVREQYHSGKD